MINKVIIFLVGFVGGCTFSGLYFKSKYEKLADAEIKDMMDWYEARLNKTEETVEQPDIESTTDAGSDGSTSWTHKISGFFKQLFNKK